MSCTHALMNGGRTSNKSDYFQIVTFKTDVLHSSHLLFLPTNTQGVIMKCQPLMVQNKRPEANAGTTAQPALQLLQTLKDHIFLRRSTRCRSDGKKSSNSPSLTSWMMSSGSEKLFSVFGNGRISDSCCMTKQRANQLRHTHRRARTCPHTHTHTEWRNAYQSLHVVHGPQVVPDDRGGDLATDVLTELVSDADHVKVTVHP